MPTPSATLPRQAGTIRWNGQPIDDPGQFLVPPRAAYAGQVPRLFSSTMRENLLLGWPDDAFHSLRALANCGWAVLGHHPESGHLRLAAYNRVAGP